MTGLRDQEAAEALAEMADLLELKGEQAFRVQAYRRAAEVVARSGGVLEAYRRGERPQLAGVGPGTSEKLAELAATGRLEALEHLRAEVPPSLRELLALPGVGPRTASEMWRTLGITDLDALGLAAESGALRDVPGIGERGLARTREALERHAASPRRRWLVGQSHQLAQQLEALLLTMPGVRTVWACGSLRRARETIGDIDLLVESDQPAATLAALRASGVVEADDDGPHIDRARASLRLHGGPMLDVMIAPPGGAGSHLVHFTGSDRHNVRLRQRARDLGWTLSEHGLAALPDDGGAGPPSAAPVRTFESEDALYAVLGLAPIAPELREDRGEVEAAAAGTLPRLVTLADLRGDCHSHSDWSDGREPLETMVEAARRRGLSWLVLTDHSQSLAIARGLAPERVEAQRGIIDELNARFAREEAMGGLPQGAHPDGFRLFHGCELEIRTDGRLDYEDGLLETFDVVVASLHVGRRQPQAQLMERYRAAMLSRHVDIIAHPSGRKIGTRPDLDLDWEAFYRLAAETGTLLEVNGSEERLDLDEERIRAALSAGCLFTIDSDAHDTGEWDNLRWGTGIARRAWLSPWHVANTLDRDAFVALIADKPHRMPRIGE